MAWPRNGLCEIHAGVRARVGAAVRLLGAAGQLRFVLLLSGAPGGGAVEASEAEWSTEGQAGLRARRRAWPSVPIGLVPMIQVVLVDQSRVALMIAQRPRRGDRLITSSRPRKARSASELGDGPDLPYRSASCQSSGSFWSTRAVGLW